MNLLLLPLAVAYDAVTALRNLMYDHGILTTESYDIPVICVGNLAVGGTGKTPHTEYLVRLLQANGYRVAVLSRGYKRRTKGFVLATSTSTAEDIGDEPLQMKRKFPSLTVAVDANRCEGIRRLMADEGFFMTDKSGLTEESAIAANSNAMQPIDVILLDDAFQHRRVKAGLNILLTDCHRLYCNDYLLPAGRLRENRRGARRADIVIVTKMDADVNDFEAYHYYDDLDIRSGQDIYFTRFRYGDPYNASRTITLDHLQQTDASVLLITGIANPAPLEHELSRYVEFQTIRFADHHAFTHSDYMAINHAYEQMPTDRPRIVLTTEKDFTRLHLDGIVPQQQVFAIPIEVEVLHNEQEIFNQQILDYVRKNTRNRTVPQATHDHTA